MFSKLYLKIKNINFSSILINLFFSLGFLLILIGIMSMVMMGSVRGEYENIVVYYIIGLFSGGIILITLGQIINILEDIKNNLKKLDNWNIYK